MTSPTDAPAASSATDEEARPVPPAAPRVLGAQDILNVDDIQRGLVEVPEWGGSVWVWGLSGDQRDALTAMAVQADGSISFKRVRAHVAAMSIRDAAGNRLFDERATALLGTKSSTALDRVFEATAKFSGMTPTEVEAIAGESGADPSGDSSIA